MFEPGGKKRDKKEFLAIQTSILEEDEWIIEGCSFSTFEMRFSKAETVIYFQFSRYICFWRIFKRLFNYKKEFSGLRVINWELVKYIWKFDKEKGFRIEELKKKYSNLNFYVFRTAKDVDKYLFSLKRESFLIRGRSS
jgi:adenylate kinase family enzyme